MNLHWLYGNDPGFVLVVQWMILILVWRWRGWARLKPSYRPPRRVYLVRDEWTWTSATRAMKEQRYG